jgi:hypothetical protein
MLESTRMITKKKLLGESSLSSLVASDRDMLLPLIQVTFAKDGEPDKILTLGPSGLRDFFASLTMEHASELPIDEEIFKQLATALQIEPTEQLRHEIYTTVIGTVLMIVRGWHSPRALLRLLKELKRDPIEMLTRSQDDPFVQYVIQKIQDDVSATQKPTREVINDHIDAIREVIGPGRPDEAARSIFFEAVIDIAQRSGDRLALPRRDDSREHPTTSLLQFASEMRNLLVIYGNAVLDRRRLPRGRFDGFEQLERDRLVGCLEAARRTILREQSMGSVNSTI